MNKLFLIAFTFLSVTSFAQDDLMDMLEEETSAEAGKEVVRATFKGIKLVNANTIETTKKKTLEFRITHRFGDMKIDDPVGKHTLYGLDNASNIRFSFDYGLTDKISIGFGRSKIAEHLDFNVKYRFLEQKQKGFPLSVAYYGAAALTPIANVPNDEFSN